jgi:hypothetical protein
MIDGPLRDLGGRCLGDMTHDCARNVATTATSPSNTSAKVLLLGIKNKCGIESANGEKSLASYAKTSTLKIGHQTSIAV